MNYAKVLTVNLNRRTDEKTESNMPLGNRKIFRSILALTGLGLLMVGMFLSIQDKAASATATYGSGFLVLIIAFMSRFKRFKGMGFEAELWDETKEQAERLVKQLNQLTKTTAYHLNLLSAMQGRLTAPSRSELFELAAGVEKIMKDAGFEESDIAMVRGPLYKITAIDMASPVVKTLEQRISQNREIALEKIRQDFGNPVRDAVGYGEVIKDINAKFRRSDWQDFLVAIRDGNPSEKLARFIASTEAIDQDERGALQAEWKEHLADLEYWVTHRVLRRPEVWLEDLPTQ